MKRASVNREYEALLKIDGPLTSHAGSVACLRAARTGRPNLPVQRQPPNFQNEVVSSRSMRAHCLCLSIRARPPGPILTCTSGPPPAATSLDQRAAWTSTRRQPWSAACAPTPRPPSSSPAAGRSTCRTVATASPLTLIARQSYRSHPPHSVQKRHRLPPSRRLDEVAGDVVERRPEQHGGLQSLVARVPDRIAGARIDESQARRHLGEVVTLGPAVLPRIHLEDGQSPGLEPYVELYANSWSARSRPRRSRRRSRAPLCQAGGTPGSRVIHR